MLTFEVPLVRIRVNNQVEFTEPKEIRKTKRVTPIARSLALGHRIVRAVELGEVESFREAARSMGVSHAQVSALVALTGLSPRIQEAILNGADEHLGFATLLRIARTEGWMTQEELAEVAIRRQRLWGANSRMGSMQAGSAPNSRPKDSQKGGSGEQEAQKRGKADQHEARPRSLRIRVSP
jgi:hypothetical protein